LGKPKRFSAEYTMLTILEYLCLNSKNTPISKYHIMTKIQEIKQQRPDRISMLLNKLEQNGYVSSIETSNARFYTITQKGIFEYLKWVKDFLLFVRTNNEMIS